MESHACEAEGAAARGWFYRAPHPGKHPSPPTDPARALRS